MTWRLWLSRLLVAAVLAGLTACSTGHDHPLTTHANSAFTPIARVLVSPRCLNCHTMTYFPRQGEDRHPHLFLVARGPEDRGVVGKHCNECHQTQNQGNGVPGAPNWRLAPLEMTWESEPGKPLSEGALCRRLLDLSRNGHRNLEQLTEHLATERLVVWAWSPGTNLDGEQRLPPPLEHEQFLQAFRAWQADGATCPP